MAEINWIESTRLILRPFTLQDVGAALEYQSNPDVVKYLPWSVRDAAEVEVAVARAMGQTTFDSENDYLSLALERRVDGRMIGQLNAMYISEANQCAEIGYVLNPAFGGNGYATESSDALVRALFDTQKFRRVVARMDVRNVASQAVARRLGFRREAYFVEDKFLKGEWISSLVFATLHGQWTARPRLSICSDRT